MSPPANPSTCSSWPTIVQLAALVVLLGRGGPRPSRGPRIREIAAAAAAVGGAPVAWAAMTSAQEDGAAASAAPSIFSRILAGEIPGEIVLQTERVFVLRDIAPKAPLHLLVVPKTPEYRDVTELAAGDPTLLAEVVRVAQVVAVQAGRPEFRLVFNTGAAAGQTVFHVHAHVLAGELDEHGLFGEAAAHGAADPDSDASNTDRSSDDATSAGAGRTT